MNIFTFYRTPYLYFGPGSIEKVPYIASQHEWKRIALFTGSSSFRKSKQWGDLRSSFNENGIEVTNFSVSGEPSPELIDECAEQLNEARPEAVVSIGGGSVIDTGKAVSAMMKHSGPIRDYLEGVGDKKPTGEKLPFIAVPTTSGTGSEASKNAVISSVGKEGFKKSLRHDNFVPDYAVVDPEVVLSCPANITAASGLDALTQLLEGYVSSKASPLTDSIAIGGLMAAGRSLEQAVKEPDNLQARTDMAYAAYASGMVLANAGLGVVHGIAGPMGGYTEIPHGTACGTLLAEATRKIIDRLLEQKNDADIALSKYADAGRYVRRSNEGSGEENREFLISLLEEWIDSFDIPPLSAFGIGQDDVPGIAEKSGIKNTPVRLTKEDISEIIFKRLR